MKERGERTARCDREIRQCTERIEEVVSSFGRPDLPQICFCTDKANRHACGCSRVVAHTHIKLGGQAASLAQTYTSIPSLMSSVRGTSHTKWEDYKTLNALTKLDEEGERMYPSCKHPRRQPALKKALLYVHFVTLHSL